MQIPLLFAAFPGASPAVLFGTNKLASVVGTSSAAIQYARRIAVPWRLALPSAGAALLGSWFGAKSVSHFSPELVRPLVLILLVSVAIYTFMRKFRQTRAPVPCIPIACRSRSSAHRSRTRLLRRILWARHRQLPDFPVHPLSRTGFSPGVGNGQDRERGDQPRRDRLFVGHGSVLWLAAGVMASCNLAGAVVGTRLCRRSRYRLRSQTLSLVVTALILAGLRHPRRLKWKPQASASRHGQETDCSTPAGVAVFLTRVSPLQPTNI